MAGRAHYIAILFKDTRVGYKPTVPLSSVIKVLPETNGQSGRHHLQWPPLTVKEAKQTLILLLHRVWAGKLGINNEYVKLPFLLPRELVTYDEGQWQSNGKKTKQNKTKKWVAIAFRRRLEFRNSDLVLSVDSGAISGEAQQRAGCKVKSQRLGVGWGAGSETIAGRRSH